MKDIYEKEITVQSAHLDLLQHVNNVTYLQWVQDMAEAHWTAKSTHAINEEVYWVVLSHYIEYKKPAFLGDQLTGRTFVENSDGFRSERHVEFYRGGQLLARAETQWCLIDRRTHRPKRISEEIKELFRA
ncbi:MAG: thioesterase family protein [Bacteroidota bacterium]